MKYYVVNLLSKGKKESILLKAQNKEEAKNLATLKKGGIVLKIYETSPPLEDRLEELKNMLFSFLKEKKN